CRMIDLSGQSIGDRGFKRVVVQDGRIDEGGELRLAPHDVFGLATNARPHGIEFVDGRPRLMLRHCKASGNWRCILSYWARPYPIPRARPKTYAYRPMNDATGSMAYRRCCAKNSSTADLNARSPTANMWSRPGITRAFAPGIRAARASGEPAIASCSPTATRSGTVILATSLRLSVCREPRMQAASACRSDLVCSAKARKT